MTIRLELLEHSHEVADDKPFTILMVWNAEHTHSRYVAFGEPYNLQTVIDGLRILADTLDKPPEKVFNAGETVIPGEDNDPGT